MTTITTSQLQSRQARPGSGPAATGRATSMARWRLAGRLAWREVRRRPIRAALVVALVALPTLVLAVGTITMRTQRMETYQSPEPDADLIVPFLNLRPGQTSESVAEWWNANEIYFSGSGIESGSGSSTPSLDQALAALPSGSVSQKVYGFYTDVTFAGNSTNARFQFKSFDSNTPAAAKVIRVAEGRAPGRGEAAISYGAAKELDLDIGDTLTLDSPPGSWPVVGLTRDFQTIYVPDIDPSNFVVDSGELWVTLPDTLTGSEIAAVAEELQARNLTAPTESLIGDGEVDAAGVAGAWLVGVLLFMTFGIIVVAAFATIARSQLTLVAQLSANGAVGSVLRRTLTLQGFWAAGIGVAVGLGLTAVSWPLIKAFNSSAIGWPVDPVWRLADVVAIIVIGITTGAFAAALPARSLARVSVLDGLAGRRPQGKVPTWVVPVGVTCFVGGLGLMVLALGSTTLAEVATVLAIGLIVVGGCMMSPLIVQLLGRIGHRTPLAIRLTLRSLGRSRLRSSAVISSIAVAGGVAAVIVAAAALDQGGPRPGEVRDDVAVAHFAPRISLVAEDGSPLDELDQAPDAVSKLTLSWRPYDGSDVVSKITNIMTGATVSPLRYAYHPPGTYEGQAAVEVWRNSGGPIVADDATLAAYGLGSDVAAKIDEAGYAMVVAPPQSCPAEARFSPELNTVAGLEPVLVPVEGVLCWTAMPFITETATEEVGLTITETGSVFSSPKPLDEGQKQAVLGVYETRDLASVFVVDHPEGAATAAVDQSSNRQQTGEYWVETRFRELPTEQFIKLQAIVLAVILAVIGVIASIGLALAANDARRDNAILSVVGASPRVSRLVASVNAWVITIAGLVLGVPLALLASRVITAQAGSGLEEPTGVPWAFLAAQFLVIPLAMATIAFVTSLFKPMRHPMGELAIE